MRGLERLRRESTQLEDFRGLEIFAMNNPSTEQARRVLRHETFRCERGALRDFHNVRLACGILGNRV
jgi:hypothetical protein